MAGPRTSRKPTFFWQGMLILLPVAVLAALGWASLRQDKILAEHDARERAQTIADAFLQEFSADLTATESRTNAAFSFVVDPAGSLIFPPAWNPLPTPQPFNPAELNAEQARLWATLQAADAGHPNGEVPDQAFKEFMDSNPPGNFAGAAGYGQGLRLIQQGKFLAAAEALELVTEKYPNATGESGLPLWPLAQFKLFEILPHPYGPRRNIIRHVTMKNIIDRVPLSSSFPHFVSLDALCSNLVCHPTPLSPYLLTCIQEDLGLPEGWLPQSYHTEKLQRREEDETENGVRLRPPRSDAQLVEDSEFEKWQRLWRDHETARRLYAAARPHLFANARPASPAFPLVSVGTGSGNLPLKADGTAPDILPAKIFWCNTPEPVRLRVPHGSGFEVAEQHWLAIRLGDPVSGGRFVCHSESELGLRVTELAAGEKHIPDYFGIGVEVAGKKISAFAPDLHLWTFRYGGGGKSSGREIKSPLNALATNVLASAVQPEQLLKVSVYLTSPDKLYQRQGARTFWFGSLVAVSAAAALIGLLAAWRAFRQQRELNEMKSNFVSSVSHELRAPIASVRLMAENLAGGKIPESKKQKEYFGFIVQECRRLSALIENVLDFSRIEQGRKQYEFEPTDVMALLKQTVTLMQPNAAEKQVQLVLQQNDSQLSTLNSQPVEMDGRAIQQALVNLIDNAIKHSPKGETVTVELKVHSPQSTVHNESIPVEDEGQGRERSESPIHHPPSTIHLSVSDRGPGIPPEEHEKIFERFYRRGSELRRETQGVGIGLSIVKHIVEAHGGRVLVQSAVGQGSRFTIELPVNPIKTTDEHGGTRI